VTTLLEDVRFGLRILFKQPGFALAALFCLGLGIGTNTAIFSVVNGVMLKPLPYPHRERRKLFFVDDPRYGRLRVPPILFLGWREQSRTLDSLAALRELRYTLTGDGAPEQVRGAVVSPALFRVLRVRPAFGRTFFASEEERGHAPVALISWRLFERRYGHDPSVVGKTMTVNGGPATLVGVMPRDFHFPEGVDLWIPPADLVPAWPLARQGENPRTSWNPYLEVIGRLKPGVTGAQARAELETIAKRLDPDPEDAATLRIEALTPRSVLVEHFRPTLLILFATVFLILLIACANVANLMLAKAASRKGELAVRSALGAGRSRLIRQLLTESVVLGVLGGAVGSLLAIWGVAIARRFAPLGLPRVWEVRVDWTVLSYLLGISVVAGILFGLIPALKASQPNLSEGLKEGSSTTGGRGRNRVQRALIALEVALTLVISVAAGLLSVSVMNLQRVDLGFNPRHALTVQVSLPPQKYKSAQKIRMYCHQALAALRDARLGEVSALTSLMPFNGDIYLAYRAEGGRQTPPGHALPMADLKIVSPGYFRAMGIRLLRGRTFTETDRAGAAPVAIISESMARRAFGAHAAIGKRIAQLLDNSENGKWLYREVVGVVRDIRSVGVDRRPSPALYVPYRQSYSRQMAFALRHPTFVLRTKGDPLALRDAAKAAIWSVDRNVPVQLTPLESIVAGSLARRRLTALLLGLFAVIALFLAAFGTYSLVSYAVAQRTHEIGIRVAIGARQADILRLVVGRGMKPVFAGLAVGLIGVVVFTRVVASLLYGVSALDPLTILAACLLLAGVALLACIVPALKATRVDPAVALRAN